MKKDQIFGRGWLKSTESPPDMNELQTKYNTVYCGTYILLSQQIVEIVLKEVEEENRSRNSLFHYFLPQSRKRDKRYFENAQTDQAPALFHHNIDTNEVFLYIFDGPTVDNIIFNNMGCKAPEKDLLNTRPY